ncbi:hypothetical protein [Neptunicella sp. SCSIO 80796]|uniref:hypothetical protein n=1 Tax=Neptunicella plasticusilytica TaxID=3117012 RepID=UPI003A4E1263
MKKLMMLVATFASCILLSGCIGIAAEGTRAVHSEVVRSQNIDAALAGNAEAQYKIGSAYCCSPNGQTEGYYDNQKATEFLCMAAIQGHGLAALKLGKIHSGDLYDGVRLLQRARTAMSGNTESNLTVATYWLTQAKLAGIDEASTLLNSLPNSLDISHFVKPENTPCTIKQVYGV